MAGVITTTITFASGDQVTSTKLNEISIGSSFTDDAVNGTTLSVVGGKLQVGTITSSQMGANSVTTTALTNLSVTTAKIADGAIGATQLGSSSVTTDKLAPGSVTTSRLNAGNYASQTIVENQLSGYIVDPPVVKYSPFAVKGYGEFNITGTGRNIKPNSVNVASLTRIDSTHTTVVLAINMDSANYTVDVTGISGGSDHVQATVYDKAASSFKIFHTAEGGSTRAINFIVCGKFS